MVNRSHYRPEVPRGLQEVEVPRLRDNIISYFTLCWFSKMVNQSHYRPEVPRGLQEVKVPRLRDNIISYCTLC